MTALIDGSSVEGTKSEYDSPKLLDDIVRGEDNKAAEAAPAAEAEKPAAEEVKVTPAEPSDDIPADVFKPKAPAEEIVKEPVAEPAVEEISPPPNLDKDPKANRAWKAIKDNEKKLLRRVEELEDTLKREKEKPVPEVAEVAKLKEQIDAYEERIGQLDVAQSSAFKQRFDAPMGDKFRRGAQLLVKAGHDEPDAIAIMSKIVAPGATFDQVQDALVSEPLAVQGSLLQLSEEVRELAEKRTAALQDWKSQRAALAEEQQRMGVAELSKAIVRDTSEAVNQLVDEGSWLFKMSDTDEKWNDGVRERVRAVHGILKASKPAELVKYVADGVASRLYRSLYEKERVAHRKLRDEVGRRLAASPGVGARGAPEAPSKEEPSAINPDAYLSDILVK